MKTLSVGSGSRIAGQPQAAVHFLTPARHSGSLEMASSPGKPSPPVGGNRRDIVETGEPDAYGHKKLGGIGQLTADMIKRLTGQNTLYQQLGYLMRSGAPDALDRLVAANYGALAVDLAVRGITGRMVALREGRYTHVAADMPQRGVKRVDVDEFYDLETYRPKVAHVQGKPMFLY